VDKSNLLGFTKEALQQAVMAIAGKKFHGSQIFKWIHRHRVVEFERMTDLSKSLRKNLIEVYDIGLPTIASERVSNDGTIKWLIKVAGGSLIETVFIPKPNRSTLCISSQAGCMLNCSFCQTARQGFSKNLSTAEIIGQLWLANNLLKKPITNVVMMGMGEPLLNFTALKAALSIMRDECGYNLPRRRVTVSTSGVVPMIYRLATECDVTLAVSLHAPTDELRNQLVPINKKYPIANLLDACKYFIDYTKNNKVTIEYVMLKEINDSIENAKQLSKILQHIPCKVNLIPFNIFTGSQYQPSTIDTIKNFSQILIRSGLVVTIRESRGEDIEAACGQLAGKVLDRTKRSERYAKNMQTAQFG
jgi:23S rRNA (adenine2503-C2)-methyltransferase